MSGPSQVERAYQEIRQRIVEGRYRPGVHLSEAMLARVHRVSRTPVREALSRLQQDGYVEFVPKRGYAAAPVTLGRLQDIFEVRRLLESAAAARAATSATADDVSRLQALAPGGYSATDRRSYLSALARNQRFHLAVAEAGRNAALVSVVGHCLSQMDRALSLSVDYAPFHDVSDPEHCRIVGAIERRDGEAARRAMEDHLDHSHDLLLHALVRRGVRGGI